MFCSLYTDRGSHCWHTPMAGGKVDKGNSTQFRRALQQLGMEMIAAYSPEARGRSERAFRTHQDRLVKEPATAAITDMAAANEYLQQVYPPAFNGEFEQPPREAGSAFMPVPEGTQLDNIFCERYERQVRKNNYIEFEGLTRQIPVDRHRHHYIKAKVKVLRHTDGTFFSGSPPTLILTGTARMTGCWTPPALILTRYWGRLCGNRSRSSPLALYRLSIKNSRGYLRPAVLRVADDFPTS